MCPASFIEISWKLGQNSELFYGKKKKKKNLRSCDLMKIGQIANPSQPSSEGNYGGPVLLIW